MIMGEWKMIERYGKNGGRGARSLKGWKNKKMNGEWELI